MLGNFASFLPEGLDVGVVGRSKPETEPHFFALFFGKLSFPVFDVRIVSAVSHALDIGDMVLFFA